ADLRRAISDAYYAMFHRLCEALVEHMNAQDPSETAFKQTFETLYRLPDHKLVTEKCKQAHKFGFSKEVVSFANGLAKFKLKREQADYNPLEKFAISEVRTDIETVETHMKKFDGLNPVERSRFAYFVCLKVSRGKG
ncbi:MAG: hypothetical protein AAF214_12160, partial [Pseudomonadota bacterium]